MQKLYLYRHTLNRSGLDFTVILEFNSVQHIIFHTDFFFDQLLSWFDAQAILTGVTLFVFMQILQRVISTSA